MQKWITENILKLEKSHLYLSISCIMLLCHTGGAMYDTDSKVCYTFIFKGYWLSLRNVVSNSVTTLSVHDPESVRHTIY